MGWTHFWLHRQWGMSKVKKLAIILAITMLLGSCSDSSECRNTEFGKADPTLVDLVTRYILVSDAQDLPPSEAVPAFVNKLDVTLTICGSIQTLQIKPKPMSFGSTIRFVYDTRLEVLEQFTIDGMRFELDDLLGHENT